MVENKKWFANRGQIIQTCIALAAFAIASRNVWPDLKKSEYLSLGAFLFYVLTALVIVSVVRLLKELRRSGGAANLEEFERRLELSNAEVKRLTDGVAILQSKLTEELTKEANKTNEKDQLLREAKASHRETHQRLERCSEDLRIQRIHTEEARNEMAWLKLHDLTREQWNAFSAPRQPSVRIQWIGWKESLPIANEIESVFKKLDWHVVKEEARDAGSLKNGTRFRVVMESRTNILAGQVAGLFNHGKLITQDATPSDLLHDSVPDPVPGPSDSEGTDDLIVTVFP